MKDFKELPKSVQLRMMFDRLSENKKTANGLMSRLMNNIKDILKATNDCFDASQGIDHTITDFLAEDENGHAKIKVMSELWYSKEKDTLVCKCTDGTETCDFVVNDIPYLADEIIDLEEDFWVEEAEDAEEQKAMNN